MLHYTFRQVNPLSTENQPKADWLERYSKNVFFVSTLEEERKDPTGYSCSADNACLGNTGWVDRTFYLKEGRQHENEEELNLQNAVWKANPYTRFKDDSPEFNLS